MIRKIVIATGAVTTLAGSGVENITTDGVNLYVTDGTVIRKIVIATGEVTTLAGGGVGSGVMGGGVDGTGTAASFAWPKGITTDGTNLYVADYGNVNVRKIVIATGVVTTLVDSRVMWNGGKPVGSGPMGITTDGSNLYVSDYELRNILKIQ